MGSIVRLPLVSSQALVRAFDPFAPQTLYKSRFNALRPKVSHGLRFDSPPGPRGERHGTFHAYCSLNVDSARLLRRGHRDLALELSHIADDLEKSETFREVLELVRTNLPAHAQNTDEALMVGLSHAVTEPLAAEVLMRADTAMADARAAVPGLMDLLSEIKVGFFTVSDVRDDHAVLEGDTGFYFPVARGALASLHLDYVEAPVAVEAEIAGGTQLLSFDPAIDLGEAASGTEWLPRRTPYELDQPMDVWPAALLERLRTADGRPEPTVVGPLPPVRWREPA